MLTDACAALVSIPADALKAIGGIVNERRSVTPEQPKLNSCSEYKK